MTSFQKPWALVQITVMHALVLFFLLQTRVFEATCNDCFTGWSWENVFNLKGMLFSFVILYAAAVSLYAAAAFHKKTSKLLLFVCTFCSLIFLITLGITRHYL
jgi:hypothetical protein